MSRILLFFFMAFGGICATAYAERPIDFSTSDNLKAIYDAGFRPWRTTMSSCHLDHVNVSIILPENGQFSLPVEMAEFSVLDGDQLSSAKFYSEVISTDVAVAKTREICEALGMSTRGLDQAAPVFGEKTNKPTIWNSSGQKGGISLFVTLDFLYFEDHLAAKTYVFLQWNRNGAPMKFLTKPIQPPPGYENVSMDPPKVNPNQVGFPKHDLDYYKNLAKKAKAGDTNPAPLSPVAPAPPVAPQPQPASETGIPWWIYAIVVLGLGVGTWFIIRSKK